VASVWTGLEDCYLDFLSLARIDFMRLAVFIEELLKLLFISG
jgi:hypothetical protein